MKEIKYILTALLLAVPLAFVGCDGGDDVGDHLEDAGDSITDAADDAGDHIEDAADDVGDEIDDATN